MKIKKYIVETKMDGSIKQQTRVAVDSIIETEMTPEWAMKIARGEDDIFKITSKGLELFYEYGFASNNSDDLIGLYGVTKALLQNPHTIEVKENKNFKNTYAIFEDGFRYEVDSEIIGRIPKTNSDAIVSARASREDGNIWTGDSKND